MNSVDDAFMKTFS